MTPTSGQPATAHPVLAAGVLLLRTARSGPEVLLVHRPRYDDWSFPKGKRDRGEPLPVTAVREAAEETGYRVRLHRPLPTAVYRLPDGRAKSVEYWVATVRSREAPGPGNPREIDRTRWVLVTEAYKVLTRHSDLIQLDALRRYLDAGTALTQPVVVQRHAAALSRSKWRKGEATRPLNKKGKRQAKALPPLLDAWAPQAVVTSPWKRCEETVVPFLEISGIKPSRKEDLTEKAAQERPSRAAAVLERVLAESRSTVICTHRPVLPTFLGVVGEHATRSVELELPAEDPYLAAGEMLVLHVADGDRVVAAERHQPLID
jgi:8-oxo-(d)GTP phosphatase